MILYCMKNIGGDYLKKILINIKNNYLIFSFNYKTDEDIKKIIDTNIISDNKLVFSDDYISNNKHIVGMFIKDLINDQKIKKIIITNLEIITILKEALKEISNVDTLYISDENNFTYEAYEIIIKQSNFKKISCYSIPTYMIDLFDRYNIEVESRAEILYTSNFMEENNLTSYSKIYYKTSLKIAPPLTEQDYKDFEAFCKINRYIKNISFNACSIDGIKRMSNILIQNRLRVKIIINDNITSKEMIEELKKLKKSLKKHSIILELKYTKEYINKNFMKQLITSTILLCAFLVFVIASGSTIYVVLNNKESEKNIERINQRIEDKIAEDNIKREEKPSDDTPIEPTDSMIPKMKSLLDLNEETVGWITIPGTNIDYPVVKTNNNDFYLDHNFEKQKDYNGWVFMNHLNNPRDLNKNTIIFAHNRYYSGVMFGTLSNLTKEKWYSQAKNISIFYNTLYEEMEWEVFSIYRVQVTDDYLQTSFSNDTEWLDFINLLKQRSMFASDTSITPDDKILTLSTCLENDQRLVVHAVLKK